MPKFASPDRDSRRHPRSFAIVLTAMAVVLVMSAAACGSSTAPSPSAVASTATQSLAPTPSPRAALSESPTASLAATGHIVVAQQGFALTLPDGWESLPVDQAGLQAFIATLPAGSQLRSVLEDQASATIQQAVKFWAFDVRPENAATGFARNVNVIVQPPTTMNLATIQAAAQASLETLDAIRKPVKSSIVQLPAGEVLKLEYVVDVAYAGAGKSTAVAGTQYYIQLPKSTLIVSFSTDLASQAAATTDFDAIVKSIEAAP